MAASAHPTYTNYHWNGRPVATVQTFKIAARAGESIAMFLERACRHFEWYVGDEVTYIMRGRHITEARIVRAPSACVPAAISVHQALRTACREVAEYARGETRFLINEDGVLIHQQSTFYVERKGDDVERLAHRLGLDPDDDVELSLGEGPTAQVLRHTLRTGELIARYA